MQRSNNECEWRLSVVDSVPLVVLFECNARFVVLSPAVDKRLVRNLGQKLNLANLSRLFRDGGGNAPFLLDGIHASLGLLKFGVGLLLTLPLGWNSILFECW